MTERSDAEYIRDLETWLRQATAQNHRWEKWREDTAAELSRLGAPDGDFDQKLSWAFDCLDWLGSSDFDRPGAPKNVRDRINWLVGRLDAMPPDLDAARRDIQAHDEFRQEMTNVWCRIRGTQSVNRATIGVIAQYAREFSVALVVDWIERAQIIMPDDPDWRLGQYISGIRRRHREAALLLRP